jgi:hypothetical protein
MKRLKDFARVVDCFMAMMECAALEPSTAQFQIGGGL